MSLCRKHLCCFQVCQQEWKFLSAGTFQVGRNMEKKITWSWSSWEKDDLKVKPDNISQPKDPKTSTHRGLGLKNQQIVSSDIWGGGIIANLLNFFLLSLHFAQSRAGGMQLRVTFSLVHYLEPAISWKQILIVLFPFIYRQWTLSWSEHCQLQMPGSNLLLAGYFHSGISLMFSYYSLKKKN